MSCNCIPIAWRNLPTDELQLHSHTDELQLHSHNTRLEPTALSGRSAGRSLPATVIVSQ